MSESTTWVCGSLRIEATCSGVWQRSSGGRRPSRDPAGKRVEERVEPLRPLGMRARRVQAREVGWQRAPLRGELGESVGDRPMPQSAGRRTPPPTSGLVVEGGERGGGVQRRDSPVQPKLLRLEANRPGRERLLERAVLASSVGLLRADAARPAAVGRVAAQRDEVRHLVGLDAVALAHLAGPTRAISTRRVGWRIVVRSLTSWNMSRSDVATRRPARCLLSRPRRPPRKSSASYPGAFARRSRSPRRARAGGRAAPSSSVVELAAGLVAGERLVAVGRHRERVPADETRARLLGLPHGHEHVREADDHVRGPAARAGSTAAARGRPGGRTSRRRRRAAAGAHSVASRRSISAHQPVGRLGAAPRGIAVARSSRRSAARRRRGAARAGRSGRCRDRGRHERHAGLERDPRRPVCGRVVLLAEPFTRRVPSGNITTMWPSRQSDTAVSIASDVGLAAPHWKAPPRAMNAPSGNQNSSDLPMKRRKRRGKSGSPSAHGSRFETCGSRRARPRRRGGTCSRPRERRRNRNRTIGQLRRPT